MSAALDLSGARERQSHIFERQAEDWYVEPKWVWNRLFERLALPAGTHVHDPACGCGTSVEAACEAGLIGTGGDIVARWMARGQRAGAYAEADFLSGVGAPDADVIVSNPPFKLARAFAEKAMQAAPVACLLLPCKWACGDERARWLSSTPLSNILFLTPRPSMPPGHIVAAGGKVGGGTVDFAIFVWTRRHVEAPAVGWLHRDGDRAADWCAERAR